MRPRGTPRGGAPPLAASFAPGVVPSLRTKSSTRSMGSSFTARSDKMAGIPKNVSPRQHQAAINRGITRRGGLVGAQDLAHRLDDCRIAIAVYLARARYYQADALFAAKVHQKRPIVAQAERM